MIDATHAPGLQSWAAAANTPGNDFPIQNLPHGVFRRHGTTEPFRGGIAIGDSILDLTAACEAGAFSGEVRDLARMAGEAELNRYMAAGAKAWSRLRGALSGALRAGAPEEQHLRNCLVAQCDADYAVPASIGDFTDFFTSYSHMMNMGRIFHATAAELPSFKWLPIAYHGRSSSIEVSGTRFHRPQGQFRSPADAQPSFGPSKRLDYEMELGFFIGPGNARGQPITIGGAESHVFGVCLLNDWSARDVQGWESMPLGPFLAKNFMTSISPWIVTMAALAPFRTALPRGPDDPPEMPNLRSPDGGAHGGLDIVLEVSVKTARSGDAELRLSRTNARHTYWSLAQMVTHHTEGGCNLRPGDLLGTGTQSGPNPGEQGCLLELSAGGKEPVTLSNGETRTLLEDGDTVILRGWCERDSWRRIGFGECSGTVLPAKS